MNHEVHFWNYGVLWQKWLKVFQKVTYNHFQVCSQPLAWYRCKDNVDYLHHVKEQHPMLMSFRDHIPHKKWKMSCQTSRLDGCFKEKRSRQGCMLIFSIILKKVFPLTLISYCSSTISLRHDVQGNIKSIHTTKWHICTKSALELSICMTTQMHVLLISVSFPWKILLFTCNVFYYFF